MSEGDYKKAHMCLRRALKNLELNNTESVLAVWANLALALQLADLADEALEVYQKALATYKDSHQLVNNLGNLHRQTGNLDEAMASYRAAVRIKGDYALGYNNMALVHVLRQDWDEAADCLAKALEIDPGLDCAKSNSVKLDAVRRRAGAAGAPVRAPAAAGIALISSDHDAMVRERTCALAGP